MAADDGSPESGSADSTAVQRAAPRCPDCGVSGVQHIVSTESVERSKTRQPWFVVVHCDQCGHVYDVLAKHVFSAPITPKLVLPDLR